MCIALGFPLFVSFFKRKENRNFIGSNYQLNEKNNYQNLYIIINF